MTMKYFYVDDDTAVLFAANGTALTALLVGIADIVQLIKFSIPTYPMCLYFFGLIFAFLSKGMIQLINSDTFQREKLQAHRDFLIAAQAITEMPSELNDQWEATWRLLELQHSKLLKPHHGPRIDKLRAIFFFLSALCFLVATSTLIYLAGFVVTTVPK